MIPIDTLKSYHHFYYIDDLGKIDSVRGQPQDNKLYYVFGPPDFIGYVVYKGDQYIDLSSDWMVNREFLEQFYDNLKHMEPWDAMIMTVL